MSIDLTKREEKVRFILEKKALKTVPPIRVGVALDISGSTRPIYEAGVIQSTVDRLMAVALRFDDNGELDAWAFDTRPYSLKTATKSTYEGFVDREIIQNRNLNKWGETSYGPVLKEIFKSYFGATAASEKPGFFRKLFGASETPVSEAPALALFVTDGATNDEDRTEQFLHFAKSHPIYWQMVGVGDPQNFKFIKRMADNLPNVGFVYLQNLNVSDDVLYEELLSDELCEWIKQR